MSASGAREILTVVLGICVLCAYFGAINVLIGFGVLFVAGIIWLWKFDWVESVRDYNKALEVMSHRGINCETREHFLGRLEFTCNHYLEAKDRWSAKMLLNHVKGLTYEERRKIGDKLGIKVTNKK